MGKLLVVTGFSGAGKDAIIDELLKIKKSYRRLVTTADRPMRDGEVNGVHYYFVSALEMDRMHMAHELVEKPLLYGTSRKATPKKEFKKIIYEDASLVWRIDSSLAAHVATGEFFEEQFEENEGSILKNSTTVIFVTAPKKDLIARRKRRDGKNYNAVEFAKRDKQDVEILEKYRSNFQHIIVNEEEKMIEAVKSIEKILESNKVVQEK